MENKFQNIKNLLLNVVVFLFPLFFLNITQEFFITNKLYLLGFGALILILLTALEVTFTRKLNWQKVPLNLPISFLILSILISVVFASPNKVQSILNPSFGLLMFLSLGILYLYISKQKNNSEAFRKVITISSYLLSFLTIIFFFQPFKNLSLPTSFQFLKNPLFTTLGNQFDLAIFLGFFFIFNILNIKKNQLIHTFASTFNLIALSITLYQIFTNKIVLPPFSNSWFAVLEIMKNAKTAFIGVGLDNFSTVFTKVKDINFNQSALWQINSFNIARNLPFQLLVETGIFGFLSYIAIVVFVFKQFSNNQNKSFFWLILYLFIVSLILPPSLSMMFLVFLNLGLTSQETKSAIKETNLNDFPVIYLGISLLIIVFVGIGGYFLGRSVLAEYYFKKSLNNISLNKAKDVYDNMKKARILNPYEERFILNFSQTNLLIASSLAKKDSEKISEQDRLVITQAIQAAISEAKLLIARNPYKASYYENLANIYRNIIPLAKGADAWTISAYQRAIILDPANPSYRVGLGGVYYLLNQYSDAVKLFEQAVALKPDWANANYNLAWGYYQNNEYDKATNAMQNVVNLINKKNAPKDWEKANKELEDFKNKLVEIKEKAIDETSLSLPQEPVNKIDPKLELPPEASPEAKQ